MRVASRHWEDAKVIGRGEMLEVRNVDGRLHIARNEHHHDEWDPPVEPYDPCEPDMVSMSCNAVTSACDAVFEPRARLRQCNDVNADFRCR